MSISPNPSSASNTHPSGGRKAQRNGAAPAIDDDALNDEPPRIASPAPFPDLEAALGIEDEGLEVVELLVTVPVRKPRPTEYFRVSPVPAFSRPAYVFIDKEEIGSETYFVMPAARPYIAEHLRTVLLTTCVNRQGIPFLWPLGLPDPNANSGRQSAWGSSALHAMETAKTYWVKMTAGSNTYRVFKAEKADLPEPKWPDRTFNELLNVAFKDRLITDENHEVIRRLRGRV